MTNQYFLLILPLAIFLLWVIRRAPKSQTTSSGRPDFIAKASESRFVTTDPDAFVLVNQTSDDNSDYNYDVVGESFQRDHLVALIRAHKAFSTGQILATAILEPEPTNPFDPTAVKVVVEGVQVGYIAKFDSAAVTKMIQMSGKKPYEVAAKIGFDAESPAPLIGVKLALSF